MSQHNSFRASDVEFKCTPTDDDVDFVDQFNDALIDYWRNNDNGDEDNAIEAGMAVLREYLPPGYDDSHIVVA